jgi:hypothetical protein
MFIGSGFGLNRVSAAGDAYGILNGRFRPALVMDFGDEYYRANGASQTFSDAITHTRASTATYVDSTGTLQTAAINQPRLGHHVWNGTAWVNEGLLIEEARTNFVPNSQGGINVSSFSFGTGSFDLELEDYSVAPDGTTTGLQLKWFMGTTGGSYAGVGISAGTLSSEIRTFSFFGKSNTASNQTMQFRKADGSVVTDITITPEWQRFSITDSVASTGTGFQIWSPFSVISYTANVDISIWGMQLEAAPTPSSYIPTSGSTVTRSADVLTIPAANLPYNSTALSIQMDGRVTYADEGIFSTAVGVRWQKDAQNRIVTFDLSTNSTDTGVVFFSQEAADVYDFVGTGNVLSPDILVPFNIASRHGSTFINGAVDGVALTANTTPVALPDLSASNLQLGFDYNGTIRTFRMWGQDIGDTGLVEATT